VSVRGRWRLVAGLLLLLALFSARLVHTSFAKSLTSDEPHYIGTGLHLWATGDYDYFWVLKLQPPLAYQLLPKLQAELIKFS